MAAGCTGDQTVSRCTCNCTGCGGSVAHGSSICSNCANKR